MNGKWRKSCLWHRTLSWDFGKAPSNLVWLHHLLWPREKKMLFRVCTCKDLIVSRHLSSSSSFRRSHLGLAQPSARKHLLRVILSLLCSNSFCSSSRCSELCYKTYSMSDLSGNFISSLVRDWNAFLNPSLFLVGILQTETRPNLWGTWRWFITSVPIANIIYGFAWFGYERGWSMALSIYCCVVWDFSWTQHSVTLRHMNPACINAKITIFKKPRSPSHLSLHCQVSQAAHLRHKQWLLLLPLLTWGVSLPHFTYSFLLDISHQSFLSAPLWVVILSYNTFLPVVLTMKRSNLEAGFKDRFPL